jgi:hypothetical protein
VHSDKIATGVCRSVWRNLLKRRAVKKRRTTIERAEICVNVAGCVRFGAGSTFSLTAG